MKITAIITDPGHSFRKKKIKGGQRIFDYGMGLYANDKRNVYPIKTPAKITPISIYRYHDPCAVCPPDDRVGNDGVSENGASPTVGIATHIWWHRVLEQLSIPRKDYSKYVKWIVIGTVVAAAMLLVLG